MHIAGLLVMPLLISDVDVPQLLCLFSPVHPFSVGIFDIWIACKRPRIATSFDSS